MSEDAVNAVNSVHKAGSGDDADVAGAGLDAALASRLTVIEGRPLEVRAAEYAQLHDQLRERLEGGDVPRSSQE